MTTNSQHNADVCGSNRGPSNEDHLFHSLLEHVLFDRRDQFLKTIYSCSNFILLITFFAIKLMLSIHSTFLCRLEKRKDSTTSISLDEV
jgi:hypothetical protein